MKREPYLEPEEWRRQQREEAERAERRRKEEEAKRERDRLAAIEKAKRNPPAERRGLARGTQSAYIAVSAAVGERADTNEFQDWARWAFAEAERLDPINSRRAWK